MVEEEKSIFDKAELELLRELEALARSLTESRPPSDRLAHPIAIALWRLDQLRANR